LRTLGIDSPSFSMPPLYLRQVVFFVQKMGSTTSSANLIYSSNLTTGGLS
jgi:hypothetical protein